MEQQCDWIVHGTVGLRGKGCTRMRPKLHLPALGHALRASGDKACPRGVCVCVCVCACACVCCGQAGPGVGFGEAAGRAGVGVAATVIIHALWRPPNRCAARPARPPDCRSPAQQRRRPPGGRGDSMRSGRRGRLGGWPAAAAATAAAAAAQAPKRTTPDCQQCLELFVRVWQCPTADPKAQEHALQGWRG